MKVFNVEEIFDNGEFVTLVTKTGSAVHLPRDGKHSICVMETEAEERTSTSQNLAIDLYEAG